MDYLNLFENYLNKEKRVSRNTQDAYMSDMLKYQAFIKERGKNIEKANNADVVAYMLEMKQQGISPATVNRKLASVKQFYKFMKAEGKINNDPASGVKTSRVERKELEYLSIDEIDNLLSKPDDSVRGLRDRALLETMYATGIRASELCNINVKDVDLRIGYINVREAGKSRIVPMGKPARAAVKAYLESSRAQLLGSKEDCHALFLSYLGERLTRQGIWKILKFYGEQAGLEGKLTPQVIRNSFAAHMVQNGADLKSLQELLGHEDITATKIYLSVTKNRIMDVYDKAFPRA